METEKLKELTTDQLKKKEKEANILIIGSLTAFLACFIVLIILIPVWAGATIPILALTVIGFRDRKKMREELKMREPSENQAL